MKKEVRQIVFEKYNGLCAYTGRPLGEGWQVDHAIPKCHWVWQQPQTNTRPDDISNLLPAIKIVNHYKRALDIEKFRNYMLSFHNRLAKLPKKTASKNTIKRKEYMYKIAELFEINNETPFKGKFYFELINCI